MSDPEIGRPMPMTKVSGFRVLWAYAQDRSHTVVGLQFRLADDSVTDIYAIRAEAIAELIRDLGDGLAEARDEAGRLN